MQNDLKLELKLELSAYVTKADLRTELAPYATKADVADVRREIAETKAELIKWVVGIGIAQAGFVVAMIKLMH